MVLKIVDVSKYQGKINWSKLKPQIDGAIIQIGYGDNLISQDDPYAKYNMDECERLGIPYMTYLFSYARTPVQIQSEIAHEKRMTKGRKTLGHWLDLEVWSNRLFGIEAAKAWTQDFSDGGVYASTSWWTGPLKGLECPKWVASYPKNDNGTVQNSVKPDMDMCGWQFSSKCRFDGISGNVDCSIWYTKFGDVEKSEAVKSTGKRAVTKKEVAAIIMRHLCEHNSHGYTQDMNKRWGSGSPCEVDIYGVKYKVAGGDRDCSSAVISAFEAAGISCGGATYTGNMRRRMLASGNFVEKPMTYTAQMTDVYLNDKCHTAMCLSADPDVLMEFSINEKGTALGGKVGDQLQKGEYDGVYGRGESHLKKYYDYPWNRIMRCVNNEIAFYVRVDDSIPEKSNEELAVEVICRRHGNGENRKTSLGDRYDAVQKTVNKLLMNRKELIDTMTNYILKYGPNGDERRSFLGAWYNEVQAEINKQLAR